jgi:glucokinase
VTVTVGTGIGGAVIIDGRLLRGASGVAGEIGNMCIERDGTPCWCGNRGCLNMWASGSALLARYAALSGESDRSVEEISTRAAAGDLVARGVIEVGARSLGVGLSNVIQLLNPNTVAIGGGVADIGVSWLNVVRDEIRSRVFPKLTQH